MPIFFVLSGLILLMLTFDIIVIKDKIKKYFYIALLLIFCLSYFCENLTIADVSLSPIHLLILVFMSVFFWVKCTHKMSCLLSGVVSIFIYFIFVHLDIDSFEIFHSYNLLMIFASIITGMLFYNVFDGICVCLITIFGSTVIGVLYELELYAFAYVNFDGIFNTLILFVSVILIRRLIALSIKNKRENNTFDVSKKEYKIIDF